MNHFEKTGNLCRKIDVYLKYPGGKETGFRYLGSTCQFKTCRDAVAYMDGVERRRGNNHPKNSIKAWFAKC